jgi:hypothetical protein
MTLRKLELSAQIPWTKTMLGLVCVAMWLLLVLEFHVPVHRTSRYGSPPRAGALDTPRRDYVSRTGSWISKPLLRFKFVNVPCLLAATR